MPVHPADRPHLEVGALAEAEQERQGNVLSDGQNGGGLEGGVGERAWEGVCGRTVEIEAEIIMLIFVNWNNEMGEGWRVLLNWVELCPLYLLFELILSIIK